MKLLYVRRKTKTEMRYTKNMGQLKARVTYIKKYIFGFPIKTLHKYRETYYGEVKDCDEIVLAK
ncbi:hypothetical protein UMM65_03470 [Aureibaculum sp. 2210JD6-5]|uniref:hypothetical protein n=1 Tax=Aureibaculum sp. 2210JD6-5 TaxID=3103957 RepID=UPI002AACDB8C|nr:hypothetical protein [Aureibaculum sp. 2210JD6-5]MDY7394286.1 hypothetical protein [Aureibaculum sp. 2210JD6-5]